MVATAAIRGKAPSTMAVVAWLWAIAASSTSMFIRGLLNTRPIPTGFESAWERLSYISGFSRMKYRVTSKES